MGIILPTGVANNLGTPGAITNSIANLPDALDIATGTIFVAPDVPAIYTNDNGTWKALSGGGGAAVNPTTNFIPYNLSGVFEDSFLYNDVDSPGILKTVYLGIDKGLYCEFKTELYSLQSKGLGIFIDAAGDGITSFNKITIGSNGNFPGITSLNVYNGYVQKITTEIGGFEKGLLIDFGSQSYRLYGASNGIFVNDNFNVNSISMYVGTSGKISTESDLGVAGLLFDYGLNVYKFGDYAGYNLNGTSLIIDDSSGTIITYFNAISQGLQMDFINAEFYFGNFSIGQNYYIRCDSGAGVTIGDFLTNLNGTYIQVNDTNQKINLKNTSGSYNLSNMPSYADNAAALAAGLIAGDLYRHDGLLESQDQLRIVH